MLLCVTWDPIVTELFLEKSHTHNIMNCLKVVVYNRKMYQEITEVKEVCSCAD